ncbi:hypothetical protein GC175_17460 [bacterium]|nr:hypothetical protein [bacterium]
MNKQTRRSIVVMVVMAVLAIFSPMSLRAQEDGAINLTFAKAAVDEGVWEGTVGGDVEGNLHTVLLSADTSAPIWQVEFDWIIDADDKSFTARMSGTLNTETGAVAMQGEVIEGWLLGAAVQEEGQLVDAETSAFEGTIRVVPSAPEMLPTTGSSNDSRASVLSILIATLISLLGMSN